ncbi:MAG: hypothetical protein IJI98_11260 [Methanosphaera sp.]|uniref:hypothetical protein n=1 Tax=Methanosphaera sp. ISO3-F5 TaxID=1452353 RepID=UPI002B256CE3|nr:hypothetical protein [Methanosphaera sp. ISO3-F5]MBR0473258.1 hypothetical protein [Methanosphaera sp.]WQH64389.1 hypothetical protein PXD04_00920 [Methanosphaera sp. ISO3-F5]
METNHNEIIKQIENNNNILLYKQDLYKTYTNLKKQYQSIYISTPKKGKVAFQQILNKTSNKKDTKNKTISQIIEDIKQNTKHTKTIIYINNFEQLTRRELENYKELIQQENIQFIANINEDKEFIDNQLLDNFIILNKEEYQNNRSQSININNTILLLLSFLILLLFLRIQLSPLRYIISGLWFTLLMYRTIYYLTK